MSAAGKRQDPEAVEGDDEEEAVDNSAEDNLAMKLNPEAEDTRGGMISGVDDLDLLQVISTTMRMATTMTTTTLLRERDNFITFLPHLRKRANCHSVPSPSPLALRPYARCEVHKKFVPPVWIIEVRRMTCSARLFRASQSIHECVSEGKLP